MRKEEFLERLEMLLSDVSEEEREEAMAFYRSYFEDAGVYNEARIIAELESPENVAETIKRDLGMVTVTAQAGDYRENMDGDHGNMKRENESNYGNTSEQERQTDGTYYRWNGNEQNNPYGNYHDNQSTQTDSDKKNTWIRVLIIIIAILTFPTWFGILMGLAGIVIGLSAALVSITLSMFIVGAVFIGLGIIMLAGLGMAVVSIPAGLAFIGCGLLMLALALLLLLACVAVFGRFFPWAFKGIYNLCKKPFGKKEAQAA